MSISGVIFSTRSNLSFIGHKIILSTNRFKAVYASHQAMGAGPISSGTLFCRINAAFHLATERRIYAAAKNCVVRPAKLIALPATSGVETRSLDSERRTGRGRQPKALAGGHK